MAEARDKIDAVLIEHRSVGGVTDEDIDERTVRDYLAAMGIVEDANEARMYASMREEDASYLRGYASDLGLRPDQCVTVEIER